MNYENNNNINDNEEINDDDDDVFETEEERAEFEALKEETRAILDCLKAREEEAREKGYTETIRVINPKAIKNMERALYFTEKSVGASGKISVKVEASQPSFGSIGINSGNLIITDVDHFSKALSIAHNFDACAKLDGGVTANLGFYGLSKKYTPYDAMRDAEGWDHDNTGSEFFDETVTEDEKDHAVERVIAGLDAVIDIANKTFGNGWKPNERWCDILHEYCSEIGKIAYDIDCEDVAVEVDEDFQAISVSVECGYFAVDDIEIFSKLISRCVSFSISAVNEEYLRNEPDEDEEKQRRVGNVVVTFTFPSIWEKA